MFSLVSWFRARLVDNRETMIGGFYGDCLEVIQKRVLGHAVQSSGCFNLNIFFFAD